MFGDWLKRYLGSGRGGPSIYGAIDYSYEPLIEVLTRKGGE